jgi:general secretion pathway protein J
MSKRHERGYSLLELLIALALLSFIAIAIAGGVRFGARAWEASDTKVDAIERVQGAQNLLRTLLQQAVPRDLDPGIPVDPELFRGTSERVAFTAAAPSAFGAGGLTQFELRVETVQGGKRLVLAWRGADAVAERQAIVGGARDLRFAYGTLDQNGNLGWSDDWTVQSGAPALVMIRAVFPDGSKARWPDLVVRTRIMRDPSCVYDADTFSCRHG